MLTPVINNYRTTNTNSCNLNLIFVAELTFRPNVTQSQSFYHSSHYYQNERMKEDIFDRLFEDKDYYSKKKSLYM